LVARHRDPPLKPEPTGRGRSGRLQLFESEVKDERAEEKVWKEKSDEEKGGEEKGGALAWSRR